MGAKVGAMNFGGPRCTLHLGFRVHGLEVRVYGLGFRI